MDTQDIKAANPESAHPETSLPANSLSATSNPERQGSTLETLAGAALMATVLSGCGVETQTTSDVAQPTAKEAARILNQGTFGATIDEIDRIRTIGSGAWFNDQFDKPQTMHFAYVNQGLSTLPDNANIDDSLFIQSFWQQAINGAD